MWSIVKRFLWVLENDFSGLWSQLRSGLYLEYVLYLNFLGGIKAVSTSKWSLFKSGHMHRFDCSCRMTVLDLEWDPDVHPEM